MYEVLDSPRSLVLISANRGLYRMHRDHRCSFLFVQWQAFKTRMQIMIAVANDELCRIFIAVGGKSISGLICGLWKSDCCQVLAL